MAHEGADGDPAPLAPKFWRPRKGRRKQKPSSRYEKRLRRVRGLEDSELKTWNIQQCEKRAMALVALVALIAFSALANATVASANPRIPETNVVEETRPLSSSGTPVTAGFVCPGEVEGYYQQGNENGTRGNLVLVTQNATLATNYGATCSIAERTPQQFAAEMLSRGCGSRCASVAVWCAPAGNRVAIVTSENEVAAAVSACGWAPAVTQFQSGAPAANPVAAATPANTVVAQPVSANVSAPSAAPRAAATSQPPVVMVQPFYAIDRNGNVVFGNWVNYALPRSFHPDLSMDETNAFQTVYGGHFCEGAVIQVTPEAEYRYFPGGIEGEKVVDITLFPWDRPNIIMPYGGDCPNGYRPGMTLFQLVTNRCMAAFRVMRHKLECRVYLEGPEHGEVPQIDASSNPSIFARAFTGITNMLAWHERRQNNGLALVA